MQGARPDRPPHGKGPPGRREPPRPGSDFRFEHRWRTLSLVLEESTGVVRHLETRGSGPDFFAMPSPTFDHVGVVTLDEAAYSPPK